MRRLLIIMVIFSFILTANTLSGISIRVFGGYNLYLNDLPSSDNVTKGGFAYGLSLGYDIPFLTIGLITAYLPYYSYEYASPADPTITSAHTHDIDMYGYPVLVFARIGLGPLPFYIMGGAGVYFSKYTEEIIAANVKDSTENTKSSSDFGFALGAGYKMGLGIITIDIGGLYHSIKLESGNIGMFTINAGLTLKI